MRVVRVSIDVTVPLTTTDENVEESINAALDEPPCDWDDWLVGAARAAQKCSEAEVPTARVGSGITPEQQRTINDIKQALRDTDDATFSEVVYDMYSEHGDILANEALRQLENEADR